jgi:hypothetical protein
LWNGEALDAKLPRCVLDGRFVMLRPARVAFGEAMQSDQPGSAGAMSACLVNANLVQQV